MAGKKKAENFCEIFYCGPAPAKGILVVSRIFCINGRTFGVLFDIYLTHGNDVHKSSADEMQSSLQQQWARALPGCAP